MRDNASHANVLWFTRGYALLGLQVFPSAHLPNCPMLGRSHVCLPPASQVPSSAAVAEEIPCQIRCLTTAVGMCTSCAFMVAIRHSWLREGRPTFCICSQEEGLESFLEYLRGLISTRAEEDYSALVESAGKLPCSASRYASSHADCPSLSLPSLPLLLLWPRCVALCSEQQGCK